MTIPAPHFDVYTCELSGTTLVEASAGTGKTWALCGLYLRLLLERGLQVQQILVVTFTKAATAELRERIRGRIAEALAFVRDGAASGADTFVPHYVAGLRETHGLADRDIEAALELALQTFDEASILTIHGFCQRALADTPFVSQMPLSLDAVADDDEFVLQAANDFWRRRIAGETLDAALAAFLVQRKDSPARFAELLRRQLQKPLAEVRWPAAAPDGAATLADTAAAFAAAHEAARDQWRAGRGEIVGCLQAGRYKPEAIDAGAKAWDGLLACADALATFETKLDKAALFGSARLSPATNKGCTAPAHPFFDAAQRWLDLRAQTQTLLARTRLALLRELLAEGAAAVRKAKRASRVVAFDDMLANLHDRLAEAPALAAALRERFPAALVDEFQDTDPLQFAILRRIYAAEHRLPVFLVGDPKQAIYSFRNADLPTYLAARAEAAFEATLADNQRASEPLIDATNALFGANDRAFMLEGLAFQPVGFGDKPRKAFVDRSTPAADAASLQAWMLPTDAVDDAAESGFAGEPALRKPDALAATARATAAEIARLISAGQRGEITLAGAPLRAGDIAVLVRSHAQGARMREALARLGVASVELSQASVFRGSDAEELERLLAAIVDPTRETLLRAALATVWIGLDAAAIEALASDETALLHHVQRFVQARETWIARGAGYMLREMLRADGIAARLLARPDGERRLTNALHLTELLHDASQAHPAPDGLLRWLQTQRTSERGADDAAQLRLESDRNLVQIVTIHKAKGLEYAVVFCPFVFDGYRHGTRGPSDGIEYHDGAGARVIDFRKGLDDAFDDKAIAAQRRIESAAEDLRLIYVALTRAVHRCVIVAGGYLTGRSASAAESRRSLLNWLVAGQGQTPQEWLDPKRTPANAAAAWQALAAKAGAAFRLTALPRAPGIPVRADAAAPESLAALAAPVSMPPGWSIGSFSALARGAAHERSAVDHDTLLGAAGVQPPALPAPAADAGAAPSAEDDVVRFARGAAAGDCVHALFERIDFTAPAGWPQAAADALRAHAPTLPPVPGAQAAQLRERMLLRMLDDVLHTPLPVGTAQPLRLADVAPARRLSELEFHLPSHALDAGRLNETLAALGYAVDRLAFRTLLGYLTGFIDLVFEHDGRFFVLDWKSNHLGDAPADYSAPAVAAAMAAHGYHLQALLYCVALDRMLRRRLAGYDPARHFGGAIYLFVRGVRPGWMDAAGAPCGVHFDRPSPAAIARVSALFGEASA